MSGLVSSIAGDGFVLVAGKSKQNYVDLTVVNVEDEKPFSRTWWIHDIQL